MNCGNKSALYWALCVVSILIFLTGCGRDVRHPSASPAPALEASPSPLEATQSPRPSPTPVPTGTTSVTPTLATETPHATFYHPQPTPIHTVEPGRYMYSGKILSNLPRRVLFYDTSLNHTPQFVYSDVSFQFFATAAFTEVQLSCPSYNDNIGTLTLALHPWAGTYSLTRKTKALATVTYENFRDNEILSLALTESLPDGEYLLVVSTPRQEDFVGIWMKEGPSLSQRVYVEDMVFEDLSGTLVVYYNQTPEHLYGPLSVSE